MTQSLRDALAVTSPAKIEYIKMLVFGESGSGKTTLCGTAQDSDLTSPAFLIDIEGGTSVISDKPDIDARGVRSTKQIQEIADILHKNPKYYNTVILDSLTELRDIDMQEVVTAEYNRKPESYDPYQPSISAWGKNGARIKEIIRYLKDLPCHVVVTTLLDDRKDEQTGIVTTEPMLPGQLRKQVPGFFDIVGFLRVEKDGTRVMQFEKSKRVMAKDRTKALPGTLDNPTIPEIWDIIFKAGATIDRTVTNELLASVEKPTVTIQGAK